MKASVFFTADMLNVFNLLILSASGGRFAHCGLLFDAVPDDVFDSEHAMILHGYQEILLTTPHVDGDGRSVYVESLCQRDPVTGKNGVRGPLPYERMYEWVDGGPRRRLETIPLPLDDAGARLLFHHALRTVPEIRYARRQILQNWMMFRFGRGTALNSRSRDHWTCCEMVVRLVRRVAPEYALTTLRLGDITYDEYAPSGTRGSGLYDLMR